MRTQTPIEEFLCRLRRGEEAAVRDFVREYEPFIRRAMRPRLARAGLRAVADSADICQSALAVFLIRITAGEFHLPTREHLERLLFQIARRKFAFLVRRESAGRRDRGRTEAITADDERLTAPAAGPDSIAQLRDLLSHVRGRLPEAEQRLFALRQEGRSWDEIAGQTGVPAVLIRKRLSRALARVAGDIGSEQTRV